MKQNISDLSILYVFFIMYVIIIVIFFITNINHIIDDNITLFNKFNYVINNIFIIFLLCICCFIVTLTILIIIYSYITKKHKQTNTTGINYKQVIQNERDKFNKLV